MINMSVWLRKEQPSLALSLRAKLGVRAAANSPLITEVRVVIGSPREELEGVPDALCSSCVRIT